MSFPVLYKKDSNGKTRLWKIEVFNDYYVTSYGIEGGKITVGKKSVKQVKGKTLEETVLSNCNSEWNKKRVNGAMLLREELEEDKEIFPISPNLAVKYDNKKHFKKETSYIVQYKYDGLFCIASLLKNGKIVLNSRGREEYNFCNGVRETLSVLLTKIPEYHFVGELYIHEKSLENIISIVRGKDGVIDPLNSQVNFIVYDLIDPPDRKYTYNQRIKILETIFSNCDLPFVKLAPIIGKANNHEDTQTLLTKAESDGYEGIVLRHPDMLYYRKTKYRNPMLIKYKSFEDTEVTITGAKCATNNHEGCILFVVKLDELEPFTVTPKGDLEYRRNLWNDYNKNPNKYVGKKYTIRFFEKNSYGIPKFAVGMGIREQYDMD
jgi:ATP-dependent DNA ligase